VKRDLRERFPTSTGGAELADRAPLSCRRAPTTASFLLVAAALAGCHVVDCLAEAGVWPAARAKRDWMRPSVVRVSADLGDPAELGNDFLPDAVLKHLGNDALPSYVAGHQLQPSQSDVLTPRGAATASTCRNASKPQFRMESLRGSISHARSPSRDNLIGLVGCQTFKHARAVTHPLTGGVSS
jgi:hypothetical protein